MKGDMNHVATTTVRGSAGIFRHSARDAVLPLATLAQGAGLVALVPFGGVASAAAIAVNVWWTSNTVAHIHLHTPIFRSRTLNRAFSLYLSALTCIPQTIWKQRHLAHHSGNRAGERVGLRRARLGAQGVLEFAVIAIAIAILAIAAPRFLLTALGPGVVLGLLLCQLQGAMEHDAAGDSISHYGALYNGLWFNDGHHAEHHARPTTHWTELVVHGRRRTRGKTSKLPPFLRFFERLPIASLLGALERMPLASSLVRRAMVAVHRSALRRVIPIAPRSVAIVGGALFPRTVLALRPLLPGVRLTVIDGSAESIAIARAHLGDAQDVDFIEACYDPAQHDDHDLVIFPLAYVGDRDALYARGRTRRLVHDWAWRARGDRGTLVSLLLLKRLNVVDPA